VFDARGTQHVLGGGVTLDEQTSFPAETREGIGVGLDDDMPHALAVELARDLGPDAPVTTDDEVIA
jgi:hypothetical protein